MLKRPNRLSSTYEINKVRKYGQTASAKTFHIFTLQPKNYTGPTKVGIVVSNKFHKSAVKRNKLKRLFREAIRVNLDKIIDNLWVVVHPRFSSINKTYEEINADFAQTIQKIHITK